MAAQNGSAETIPPSVKNTKNPPGRPRKDGLPAGSTKDTDAEQDIQEFFQLLQPVSDDWWNSHTLYLYRQYPITDRRAAGKLLWIDKFSEPVDQERIMQLHGSGTYRLDLLHDGNKRIGTTSFRIFNMDYPPKVPPGDWVDDPKNKDWEWCRPKLGPQAQMIQTGVSPKELVDTMLRFKEATDRPEPRDSTAELIQTILSSPLIAKLIPEREKPAEPKEDKSLAMLLSMMQEDRKLMQTQLMELQKQVTAKPAEKSWLEVALENEPMMRRIFGRGDSGPHLDGWAAVFDKGIDKLGGAIAPLAPVIAQRLMMQQPPQQQHPSGQTINVKPAPPTELPAPAAQPVPQQEQKTPAQEEQSKVMQTETWQKYGGAIQQALPFMIDQYRDIGENPTVGYDCRDWFCKRWGNVLWDGMRNEVGVEQFVTVAKAFPPVWSAFQPEERFRIFLTDFFTPVGQEREEFFEEEEDEDDGKPDAT
jgi:hypothetical protein